MKPPSPYCTTIRLNWLAPKSFCIRISSDAPPTFAAPNPASPIELEGSGQTAQVEMPAPVRQLGLGPRRVGPDEDGVLERRTRLRRADLEPARGPSRAVDESVRDSDLDEAVVVGGQLLLRTADLQATLPSRR